MLRGINRSYLWMRGMCSQCNVPLCRAFCSGATLSPCCQAAGYQQLSLHHFQYFDNHWLQRGRISDDHSCFKLLMNGTVLTWCWRFMSFSSYSDQISFLGDCVQSLSGKTQFTRGLIQDGWREVGWLQWIPARDLTAAQDTLYIIIHTKLTTIRTILYDPLIRILEMDESSIHSSTELMQFSSF